MTAIRPAQLKHESALLANSYQQPDLFVRDLQRLLDRYADRTHRASQAGEPKSILPSYNVPAQVMRQIARDLKPIANTLPYETTELCDKLWSQSQFELRSLAAFLLGQITIDPPDSVTRRLIEWTDEVLDERMVRVLLDYGLARMRAESHKQIYALSEMWLNSDHMQKNQLGIRILLALIDHPTAGDIPMIYRLTTPYIRQASVDIRPDVLILWKGLAQSLPQETAYHLRQNLNAPDNPDTSWFVRRLISYFPPELQKSLRKELKEKDAA
jgi:hypothetical protein